MKALLRFLFGTPVPIVAKPRIPEFRRRHQEAQDRGDFQGWR